MARSATCNLDGMVIVRVLVFAIDSGSKYTLRERTPDFSLVVPPGIARTLSRALNSLISGAEAIAFILQHLITIPEASRLSGCSEAEILTRIERGELGGLCIDGVWLTSRRRAVELVGRTASDEWFKSMGYKGFRAP